jgi:hypothetical protein
VSKHKSYIEAVNELRGKGETESIGDALAEGEAELAESERRAQAAAAHAAETGSGSETPGSKGTGRIPSPGDVVFVSGSMARVVKVYQPDNPASPIDLCVYDRRDIPIGTMCFVGAGGATGWSFDPPPKIKTVDDRIAEARAAGQRVPAVGDEIIVLMDADPAGLTGLVKILPRRGQVTDVYPAVAPDVGWLVTADVYPGSLDPIFDPRARAAERPWQKVWQARHGIDLPGRWAWRDEIPNLVLPDRPKVETGLPCPRCRRPSPPMAWARLYLDSQPLVEAMCNDCVAELKSWLDSPSPSAAGLEPQPPDHEPEPEPALAAVETITTETTEA